MEQDKDETNFDYPIVTHRHQITADVADCPSCCGCSKVGKLYICCPQSNQLNDDEHAPGKWFFGPCWPCFALTLCLVAGIPLGVLIVFFDKVHIAVALILLVVCIWTTSAL